MYERLRALAQLHADKIAAEKSTPMPSTMQERVNPLQWVRAFKTQYRHKKNRERLAEINEAQNTGSRAWRSVKTIGGQMPGSVKEVVNENVVTPFKKMRSGVDNKLSELLYGTPKKK